MSRSSLCLPARGIRDETKNKKVCPTGIKNSVETLVTTNCTANVTRDCDDRCREGEAAEMGLNPENARVSGVLGMEKY